MPRPCHDVAPGRAPAPSPLSDSLRPILARPDAIWRQAMTQPPSAKKRIRRRDLFPLQNKLDRIADEMQHLNSELWQRRMDAEDRRDMARDNEPAMTPPLHE